MNRIRVGIFFGGSSREREVSFAGGRTVYDNLDRNFFEPLPIFVDSLGHFILLNWPFLYQGSIRDFYPYDDRPSTSHLSIYIESLASLSKEKKQKHIAHIGKELTPDQFSDYFDFAFLVLHGPYGEDGTLQGLLEWYKIPYSGSGILGSAIGIDKIFQKKIIQQRGFQVPNSYVISQSRWQECTNKVFLLKEIIEKVGFPFVVKSPHQGSSIGVSIIKNRENIDELISAVHKSFFIEEMSLTVWKQFTKKTKNQWIASLIDVKEGIGFPLTVAQKIIWHPDELLSFLEDYFQHNIENILLISTQSEETVIFESFIQGREFSCIVLEEVPGHLVALPPTEILKEEVHFDYRAKYLPGIVKKNTPIDLPLKQINMIREQCKQLFMALQCAVYARIDGFITSDLTIYLNDPNTTSGMNPASFLFYQAASVGLNPTQLLTFLIRNSLAARIRSRKVHLHAHTLLAQLDQWVNGEYNKKMRSL